VNTNITISYCIPVCNEHDELDSLLTQLNQFVDDSDEIVIQFDQGNTTDEVKQVVKVFETACSCELKIIEYALNKDFASFKNNLKKNCTKQYVFQIDADELLGDGLLMHIKLLLSENTDTDLFWLPRINIVKGLTPEYAISQRWNVTNNLQFPIAKEYDYHVVNFPDLQARLMKNKPEICWENAVHEVIKNHKSSARLFNYEHDQDIDPKATQDWCIIHIKALERQRRQNEFYQTIN